MGGFSLGIYICLFLSLYFEVFLLISFLEKRPRKKTFLEPDYYPTVSMAVPCYNEGKTLGKTLESLLNLDYPREKLDIMIVDDGSTDDTRAIGEAYAARCPQVKYFYKENGGKYTALNFAIERSQAELVGCLDADSYAAHDALLEVVKKFNEDRGVAAIVPTMRVYNPTTWLELMQTAEYTFGIFVKKIFDNIGAITVLPGPFSVYRREVFNVVGPFKHAHNTEDLEMAFRIQHAGLKIVNAHTAIVDTSVPQSVGALVKQRTRWTQGFLENTRDYWYMFGNPKYGNFGTFSLPFSVILFVGAMYTTVALAYQLVSALARALARMSATGIYLPRWQGFSLDWFFLSTNTLSFLIIATLSVTLAFILLGKTISGQRFGAATIASYVLLYGFLAPLWIFKAAWGTLLAQEARWR